MNHSSLYTSKEVNEIYDKHVDTVYRVCLMYLKNIPDTEDAVQDVFIKLIHHKRQFSNPEHEKAWLIVTSQNHCKNILKNWWRKKRLNIKSITESPYIDGYSHDNILGHILSLPDKYKMVIYLYYYEGYSTNEISQMLGIKDSTIRTQLRTGRKRLKIILEEEIK